MSTLPAGYRHSSRLRLPGRGQNGGSSPARSRLHGSPADEPLPWPPARLVLVTLAVAVLLRFYGRYGRFPRSRGEVHPDAVEFLARAVKADPVDLAGYDWSVRMIKRHRTEIRRHFGFRVCEEEDGAKLAGSLAA